MGLFVVDTLGRIKVNQGRIIYRCKQNALINWPKASPGAIRYIRLNIIK